MSIDDYYESSNRVECLPPIIDEESEILVLGSVPGKLSLVRREYYANPSNNFWILMQKLYNEDQPFQSYSDKLACLKRSHIALWDVIKTCWRKGSKDKSICEPECNDIGKLLRKYPNIKKIVLNGKKAEEHFFCSKSTSIPTQVASSTSGANDKTALLKGFFVNFELLFEWESCLKL